MVDGIQELVNVLQTDSEDPSKTYSAEVSRIDNEGRVWVYVEGSNIETPTSVTSAEVEAGDSVNVEWRNNKLYISGNVSNPSAGIVRVAAANTAANNAGRAAAIAQEAAEAAAGTATNYLKYVPEDGLYVTDNTDDLENANAVKIDSNSVDIVRYGHKVASFYDASGNGHFEQGIEIEGYDGSAKIYSYGVEGYPFDELIIKDTNGSYISFNFMGEGNVSVHPKNDLYLFGDRVLIDGNLTRTNGGGDYLAEYFAYLRTERRVTGSSWSFTASQYRNDIDVTLPTRSGYTPVVMSVYCSNSQYINIVNYSLSGNTLNIHALNTRNAQVSSVGFQINILWVYSNIIDEL